MDNFEREQRILRQLSDENGIKKAIWSMKIPEDWNEVAYKGERELFDPYNEKKIFIKVKDPTWMDLWKACDKLIKLLKAWDHVYIEGFRAKGDNFITVTFGS